MASLLFSIIFIGISEWTYVIIIFPIIITSFLKGPKLSACLIIYTFIVHLIMLFIRQITFYYHTTGIIGINSQERILTFIIYYIILVVFDIICGIIFKENNSGMLENKKLIEELELKYSQLTQAREEVKDQYEKLKDTNMKLEDTNKRLTGSIAEFYTLQQISRAISSIFDIKELLKYVNDIIMGVMGVNYSTIILFDDKRNKLKVSTTNIKNRQELVTLTDNINCKALMDCMNVGKPIVESFVDPVEYPFAQGREVNSLICVPLITKTRKFGLVLAEQKYYNAFNDDNLRLLDIISQQVGIAMENAELYQQMQYLANIDGLTGIFNKQYFHEKLTLEFAQAQTEDYKLSLAIFDIDHFKNFNDTYGHLFGDKVLKNISELVKTSLRSTDIVARFGGEEFVILFPHTGINEAYEKIDMLRQKISKTFITDNLVSASITVTFGVASYPETSLSEQDLLRNADDSLYEAKASGRNCVRNADLIE